MFTRFSVNSARILKNVRQISNKLEHIRLSVDKEGIATMSMQRPPANLIDQEFFQVFTEHLDEISSKQYKGMVLTSNLPTIFTGGLDLKNLYKPDVEKLKIFWRSLGDFIIKLASTEFPTAVAINGHTAAAVCVITNVFEYRVMVNKGSIGLNDSMVGIVPAEAVIDGMRYLIGDRRTELALTTSEMYSAEKAYEIGLVDEVATTKEDAVEKCKQFIRRFDNIPTLARSVTKQRVREPSIKWLKDNKDLFVSQSVENVTNPETQRVFENYLQMLKQRKTSK